MFKNKRDKRAFINFLLIAPFIVLTLIFCYYPLYGWVYAFFDYRPPRPMTIESFVGLKWFKSMVESPVKVQQILGVLRNTFVMSGITSFSSQYFLMRSEIQDSESSFRQQRLFLTS